MGKYTALYLLALVTLILGLSAIGTWDHQIELEHRSLTEISR